jgi:hypothetical protein
MPNIVTDYGAVADGQWAAPVLTISAGNTHLTSSIKLFSAGDVGKSIAIGGYNLANGTLLTSIASVDDLTTPQHITLNNAAVNAISGVQHIVCWGTDNKSAFDTFVAAFQGGTTTLVIPSGTYYLSYGNTLFQGIADLTVNATGATLACGIVQFGSIGLIYDNSHSARTIGVAAGSTSVTLVNPSLTSIFTVGVYAMMAGIDMQSSGAPYNFQFFDYVLVTAIDSNPASPTYGKITFSAPLRNDYKATWPFYNNIGADYGGPATLYAMDPGWNCKLTINGLTVVEDTQYAGIGRTINFDSCTFKGLNRNEGPFPTVTQSWTMNNCDNSQAQMEVDKEVTLLTITNSTLYTLAFQSASVDRLTMDSCTMVSGSILFGTPKTAVITNSTIQDFRPGAITYGSSTEVIANNCVIGSITLSGVVNKGYNNDGFAAHFTMSGGVITIPTANVALSNTWTIPGALVNFTDADRISVLQFKILDVSQDANGVYVHTDQSAGFPPINNSNPGQFGINIHPCPKLTMTNCSATAPAGTFDSSIAYGLSQAPQGAPIGSYYQMFVNGSVVDSPSMPVWGTLKSASMNVTAAYSGADATVTMDGFGTFFWMTEPDRSGWNIYSYVPLINLKATGKRLLQVVGLTHTVTGTQSGDANLDIPIAPMWVGSTAGPHMVNDISGESPGFFPSATVIITTDQNTPQPVISRGSSPKGRYGGWALRPA